jgi:hypothetical protein
MGLRAFPWHGKGFPMPRKGMTIRQIKGGRSTIALKFVGKFKKIQKPHKAS